MRIETILGVYDYEKVKKTFEVCFEIDYEAGDSAYTDEIGDTFDWSLLEEKVVSFVADKNYNLVERLNQDLLTLVLEYDKVNSCRVRTEKKSCTEYSEGVIIEGYREK